MIDPTSIFGRKAREYASYRPSYPSELMDFLQGMLESKPDPVIADLGCGTGIFSRLLVEANFTVVGIEPDALMRKACRSVLNSSSRFTLLQGRAEATGLASQSTDAIVAAQSFHWFDIAESRREFARILREPGFVFLVWNERRKGGTRFLEDLDDVLGQMVAESALEIRDHDVRPEILAERLFGSDRFDVRGFANEQILGAEGLVGRFMSTSYAPAPNSWRYGVWRQGLEDVYRKHCNEYGVIVQYDTIAISGLIDPSL